VTGPRPPMADAYRLQEAAPTAGARKGVRSVHFGEASGDAEAAVYDRYGLRPGDEIRGPALIEERESTCVVGPRDRVRVDARLNLVAELAYEGEPA